MKKTTTLIWILAAVILCIVSAFTGFFLSRLILPAQVMRAVVVSEEAADMDELGDEEAGYEIPPATTAETLPETGQWKKDEAGRYTYENTDGSLAAGWQEIDDAWYYFNDSNIMQTGWQEIENTWYYMDTDGEMLTGWVKDNGIWYYFNDSGAMMTNYDTPDGYWVDGSGALALKP